MLHQFEALHLVCASVYCHFTCSLNLERLLSCWHQSAICHSCRVTTHFIKAFIIIHRLLLLLNKLYVYTHANWHFGTAPHWQTDTWRDLRARMALEDSWMKLISLVSSVEALLLRIYAISLLLQSPFSWPGPRFESCKFNFCLLRVFDVHEKWKKVLTGFDLSHLSRNIYHLPGLIEIQFLSLLALFCRKVITISHQHVNVFALTPIPPKLTHEALRHRIPFGEWCDN